MDAYVKGCKAGAEFINASLEEVCAVPSKLASSIH